MENRKRYVLQGALTALTLLSLSVHVCADAAATATLPDGAVWALGLGALWLLYGALLRLPRAFRPLRLWALSALFAGVMTLGQSFAALGTAEWVTGNKPDALMYLLGRVPLYFAMMRLLLHALHAPRMQQARRITSVKAGAVLFLCWLPWYVCLFPGTVSNDSLSQLRIVLGLSPMSNANPICQTGLVGLFRLVGIALGGGGDLAVALYCILQAVLMAWLLGALIAEMERSLAPRWLVGLSFAFYAFCPIFPVFAFCVGKDTNFAMAVLWLSLETWRVMQLPKGQKPRAVRMISMALAAVLCVVLRNPGIYLALLTLAFLLLYTLRRGTLRAPLCGILSAAAVFGVLHLAVIPSMDILPMPETEEYSIPLQQVARVAASASFTPEQAAALDAVLELDKLADAYMGELSDPVKNLWRDGVSEEAKAGFWKAWLSVLKDHPATCVSATFHNTYAYLYPGYASTIKPTLLIGDQSSRTANTEGLFVYTVNPLAAPLKAFTQRLNENALYRLVVSPGLYGWITLLAAVWLARHKGRSGLISAVPALFTLAGCMLSAVNGYFRYAMPLYLCAPLLLWLMSQKKAE